MKNLATHLSRRQTKLDELSRTEALGPSTEAEIQKLLESAALDDPKISARLSELRTRAELVPVKVRQIESEVEAIDKELRDLLPGAARQLNTAARREEDELRGRIFDSLKGFITGLRLDDGLVSQVFNNSTAYVNRISRLSVTVNQADDPAPAARHFIELAEKFGIK